jgi:uncharacterized protein DUF3301
VADIYLLLGIFLLVWYFIYLRKIAEAARKQATFYCKKEGLQYIAIARRSSRLRFNKRLGIFWLSIFDVEFSGDGESSYQGAMTLHGLKLIDVELPAYRVSNDIH